MVETLQVLSKLRVMDAALQRCGSAAKPTSSNCLGTYAVVSWFRNDRRLPHPDKICNKNGRERLHTEGVETTDVFHVLTRYVPRALQTYLHLKGVRESHNGMRERFCAVRSWSSSKGVRVDWDNPTKARLIFG